MSADTAERTDNKRGWSTMCRRGDFALCERARANCTNPKHGGRGQQAPVAKAAEPTPISGARTPGFREADMPAKTGPPPAAEDVVWEDPPAFTPGRRSLTDTQIEALFANPGRWMKARTYTSGSSAQTAAKRITDGKASGVPAGVEATSRKSKQGSALYVRFVAPESAE